MKICLVSSSGGHLFQLAQLEECWKFYDRFWVVKKHEDEKAILLNEKKYYGNFPESRNVINAIKNFFLAIKILNVEKPDVLISAGAGIAPPFFLAAKIFKILTIYLEPIDFIKEPSLTGSMVYRFTDIFLVQNRKQKKWFPKAKYWGATL